MPSRVARGPVGRSERQRDDLGRGRLDGAPQEILRDARVRPGDARRRAPFGLFSEEPRGILYETELRDGHG